MNKQTESMFARLGPQHDLIIAEPTGCSGCGLRSDACANCDINMTSETDPDEDAESQELYPDHHLAGSSKQYEF
ncbi:MAG: hypothetical protein JWN18_325 [Parcubacteria group bacterium]|nr:hypothetical protein [Parcubacteria group bacterium]